ncbi:hypothetical protein OS493_007712 [Desmophyllum pertusum]|uniref:MARVEL domain-containing protein n=1 Tax=Desmophyllum pertusum TaxID=174260 RepID=A0A9X0CNZ7_9CNID|nr:hypothetical protein OS493_007712 [Desmophyllum pertusum]
MSSYPADNDKTVVINGDYVLSIRGFLKIIESIILLIAFIFGQLYQSFYSPPHLPFFFAVVFVGFVLLLLLYILFFFSLDKHFDTFNWYLLDVFFCGCLAVFIIASAGLLAREADFKEKHGTKFTGYFYDRLVAAVVLAFVAVLLLIIDIIVSLFQYRRLRRMISQ